MKFSVIALACIVATGAHAQTQSVTGDGNTYEPQIIGDTTANTDHTNSAANQIGNSANAIGTTISPNIDTRDQNTVNSAATGGSAIGNQSDNKSNASNGNQSLDGRSSVGNTSSLSGGNTMTGGANTANGGTNTGTNAQGQTSRNDVAGTNTGTNTGMNISRQSTNAGNGAGAGAGSNNRTATNVDAADRSTTNYRATAWAPVIHGAAAPALAAANMVVVPGKCGPRMMVVSRDVIGQRFKSLLPDSTFVQTRTDRLVALTDANGVPVEPFEKRGGYLIGHEVITFAVTAGTSTAGSISIGLFGRGGDAGQGGSASSGSVQQVIKEIELRDCVYATEVQTIAPLPTVTPVAVPLMSRADRN